MIAALYRTIAIILLVTGMLIVGIIGWPFGLTPASQLARTRRYCFNVWRYRGLRY